MKEVQFMDAQVMRNFVYGLFVLTGSDDGKNSGCIINTAIQASENPDVITISVSKDSYTRELIQRSRKFNLSILDEKAPFSLFKHFGFQSGRTFDKFGSYEHKAISKNGLYYITEGTNAYVSCEVDQEIDLGSHVLFTAYVTEAKVLADDPSATYSFYHSHIKKFEEQKAATGKKGWRCIICGYIYDKPDLPADFICPWCKHPASDFEEIDL